MAASISPYPCRLRARAKDHDETKPPEFKESSSLVTTCREIVATFTPDLLATVAAVHPRVNGWLYPETTYLAAAPVVPVGPVFGGKCEAHVDSAPVRHASNDGLAFAGCTRA